MPPRSRPRQNIRVACNACRSARNRCDGTRPSCSRCVQRSIRCVYETVISTESRRANFRRTNEVHDRLLLDLRSSLETLRGASDEEALQAIRHITSSGDPLGTLAMLSSTRRLPASFSASILNGSVRSGSVLPFQYELMVQHPHAYPVAIPLGHLEGDISALESSHRRMIVTNAPWCDTRLADLQIGRWSKVQVKDHDAAQLIAHYLGTDHPILGLFDADLFLDGITHENSTFCSSFLVNCVLFWASLSCSSSSQIALSLKPEFYQASHDLWLEVRNVDDVRTVAASQIFSLACACEGNDELAQDLKKDGYEMGVRLGLFEAQTVASPEPRDVRRWKAHVAWGVYNWLSLHAFYYRQPPVGEPPSLTIPGDKMRDTDESLTDPTSPFMASTITSLSKFWRILNPIIKLFVPGNHRSPLSQRLTLTIAEEIFQELLSWADENLLEVTKDGTLDKPHQFLVMHIWFHTAVMEVFRPFYGRNLSLSTFDTRRSTTEVVFWSSLNQLERVALEYRQTHTAASTSIFWHLSLLFIGNAVVRNPVGTTWRFNFMLCMYGYVGLAGAFRVADGFLRAILYMAVQQKVISPTEARQIIGQLPSVDALDLTNAAADTPRMRSGHVADLELALNDESISHVADLADKLDDALMFDDFVESEETQGRS